MADIVEFRPRAEAKRTDNKPKSNGLNLREQSILTALLVALDEAESYPKVRTVLKTMLGYDPCEGEKPAW